MSKYNLFVELAVAGDVSELKDTFDYLVRDAIESRVEGMRPEVHAAIFGSKTVESFSESAEKYHIKFKDKSGQWFKSRSFKSQNEMNQHFWSKIKPASTEVQFHGPKGRIAEDVNLLEATEADVSAMIPVVDEEVAPEVDVDSPIVEGTLETIEENYGLEKTKAGHYVLKHKGEHIGYVHQKGDVFHAFHKPSSSDKKQVDMGKHSTSMAAGHAVFKAHRKGNSVKENFGKFNRSPVVLESTEPKKFVYEHVVTEGFHDMSPEAHELVLHADNTQHLHKAQSAYVKNMHGHMKKGKYSSDKGKKLWGYYADHVAKDYHKEHGDKYSKWHHVFPKKARDEVAAHFEQHHREESEHHLKSVKEDVNMFSENAHSGQVLAEEFHEMSHAARELTLHADNTHHLYQAQAGYVNNMKTHMRKGNYSHEKGKKLWGYYADHAAKDYHKTYGDKHTPWHKAFTKKDREQVAHHFESHHRDELKHSGEVH